MIDNQLIKELERRCPGCSFRVESDPPEIRIVEYGRGFTVDLTRLGETAEEWFRREIEARRTKSFWNSMRSTR